MDNDSNKNIVKENQSGMRVYELPDGNEMFCCSDNLTDILKRWVEKFNSLSEMGAQVLETKNIAALVDALTEGFENEFQGAIDFLENEHGEFFFDRAPHNQTAIKPGSFLGIKIQPTKEI
ncbi:hypothetical protein ACFLZL_04860 [Thermodesulfobacteriota bacterium]